MDIQEQVVSLFYVTILEKTKKERGLLLGISFSPFLMIKKRWEQDQICYTLTLSLISIQAWPQCIKAFTSETVNCKLNILHCSMPLANKADINQSSLHDCVRKWSYIMPRVPCKTSLILIVIKTFHIPMNLTVFFMSVSMQQYWQFYFQNFMGEEHTQQTKNLFQRHLFESDENMLSLFSRQDSAVWSISSVGGEAKKDGIEEELNMQCLVFIGCTDKQIWPPSST